MRKILLFATMILPVIAFAEQPTCPIALGTGKSLVLQKLPMLEQGSSLKDGVEVWSAGDSLTVWFANQRAVHCIKKIEDGGSAWGMREVLGQPDLINVDSAYGILAVTCSWLDKERGWFSVDSWLGEDIHLLHYIWEADPNDKPRGQQLVTGLPEGITWETKIDAVDGKKKYNPDNDTWIKEDGGWQFVFNSSGALIDANTFADVSGWEGHINNTMGLWKTETGANLVEKGMLLWIRESTMCSATKVPLPKYGVIALQISVSNLRSR